MSDNTLEKYDEEEMKSKLQKEEYKQLCAKTKILEAEAFKLKQEAYKEVKKADLYSNLAFASYGILLFFIAVSISILAKNKGFLELL